MAALIRGFYLGDDSNYYPCKYNSKIITTVNVAPAAPAGTSNIQVRKAFLSTSGRRKYGIHARYASFIFTATVPSGYKAGDILRIPILTQAAYISIVPDTTTDTYIGAAILYVGKEPEKIR